MLEWLKTTVDLFRRLTPAQAARASAYWLAPGAILLFTMSGVFGGYFSSEVALPIAVSELRTEIVTGGTVVGRPGVALIVEPSASEFRVFVGSPLTSVWSSLDQARARDNKSRLTIEGNSIVAKTPFLGVGEPVTIIAEGPIGREVQVPGGVEKIDDLILRSKRSVTALAGVLLVCMFAFGMSTASGLPSVDPEKKAGA